jgi:hypothetical protein
MQHSKFFLALVLLALAGLQGCTVLAIVDTVGSLAVRTAGAAAGLAVDAAVGTAKVTGKVVGAVADAALPDSK